LFRPYFSRLESPSCRYRMENAKSEPFIHY
jgi:hypothetical protein